MAFQEGRRDNIEKVRKVVKVRLALLFRVTEIRIIGVILLRVLDVLFNVPVMEKVIIILVDIGILKIEIYTGKVLAEIIVGIVINTLRLTDIVIRILTVVTVIVFKVPKITVKVDLGEPISGLSMTVPLGTIVVD